MWINGLDVKHTPLSLEFTKNLWATGCCVYINVSHRQWKDSQLSLNQCQWTVKMTSSLHTPREPPTTQDALRTVRQAIFSMLLLPTRYCFMHNCYKLFLQTWKTKFGMGNQDLKLLLGTISWLSKLYVHIVVAGFNRWLNALCFTVKCVLFHSKYCKRNLTLWFSKSFWGNMPPVSLSQYACYHCLWCHEPYHFVYASDGPVSSNTVYYVCEETVPSLL